MGPGLLSCYGLPGRLLLRLLQPLRWGLYRALGLPVLAPHDSSTPGAVAKASAEAVIAGEELEVEIGRKSAADRTGAMGGARGAAAAAAAAAAVTTDGGRDAFGSRQSVSRPPLLQEHYWGEGACYDGAADGLMAGGASGSSSGGGSSGSSSGGGSGGSSGDGGGRIEGRSGRSGGVASVANGAAAGDDDGDCGSTSSARVLDRSPVIYIPPLTGTELEAQLHDKPSVPHWWCPRSSSGWFRLWPTLESLLPWQFPCYADNLRLVPGGPSHPASPPPGVSIRTGVTLEPQHGDPPGGADAGGFAPWSAVAGRLRQLGWSRDLLDAHAYDWRLSPPVWRLPGGSYERFKAAIEQKVASSGGRRVVLLGVSLGATYATGFLASAALVDEAWKAAHVERLVAISGVWAGSPRAPWDLISGRLEGLEAVLDRAAVRQLVRGLPALAWTFPSPDLFGHAEMTARGGAEGGGGGGGGGGEGGGAQPLILNTATGRNYSAGELGQALKDAGAPEAAAFWVASLSSTLAPAPNVSTHCFYSYGLTSPLAVTFSQPDFSDAHPVVRYGDGDITAPYASLAACRGWAARQAAPVRSASYYGVVHAQLTSVPAALEDIVEAVAGLAGS